MGGDMYYLTDQYHTTPQSAAGFDLDDYKPGDFIVGNLASNYGNAGKQVGYNMSRDDNGTWWFTAFFPSRTFTYQFLPNCTTTQANCTESGTGVIDPDNVPFLNYDGQLDYSFFQVPFDPAFQAYGAFDLNFDFVLPVDKRYQGCIDFINYTVPGATMPAQDVVDYAVYLPKEYGTIHGKQYPVLYLLHGGGGNNASWINEEKAHNIIDRLIMMNYTEPFITIMPAYSNLGVGRNTTAIRETLFEYLMPHVEASFNVSIEPAKRAVAGLSFGSVTTYEMYINATSYFTYYGQFSGALLPGVPQSAYNPDLGSRSIMVSAGLFDIAFDDARQLQVALDELQISCISRIAPWAAHYYDNWEDALWHFGRIVLWKETPQNVTSGHGAVPFMSFE
ncbi:Alpha/Beta hydrolase protein [Xylariales sp. PMI_506]|nr:Alpha/Beta hydrolase protein [Xylariales sp. PMI_506]